MAFYFPRQHYINKRYRRLVLEMREILKTVGIKTGLAPEIDIVDLRDRFYVTMSPGASLRFSLPIALTSQYKDGQFQIQHGVPPMSLVWVCVPHHTVQGITTPDLFPGWRPCPSHPIWTLSPCSMATRKAGIYVK